MTSHALKLKERLKPGEKVPLCFDECFKIMFGNEKHLEPLTFLISNILEVGYNEIEGKIALSPLRLPNDTIGEKKMERGILVTLKEEKQGKIILEVNVKKNFYETVINRNLNYLSEVASKGLKESDSYDDIIPTLLVNFNTFYVDNIHKKIFDEYYFRNEEGHILTENQKILSINSFVHDPNKNKEIKKDKNSKRTEIIRKVYYFLYRIIKKQNIFAQQHKNPYEIRVLSRYFTKKML